MKVILDENGYVRSCAIIGDIIGSIDIDMPEGFEEHTALAYKFSNGALVLDQEREQELILFDEQENSRLNQSLDSEESLKYRIETLEKALNILLGVEE